MVRIERLADNVVLHLGNCREVLPTIGPVNAVLTDPPYGIEEIVGAYGRSGRNIAGDKSLGAMVEALEVLSSTQRDVWLAVFYSCRISPAFFRATQFLSYYGEIIWNKKAPGMGGALRYQHENIALFRIGEPPGLGACFSVLPSYRVGEVHPHQKPVALMQRLCEVVPGRVVLDPFMGSGSTGVAAVQMGRGFVGVEIDAAHFDVACSRIYGALGSRDMFALAAD